MTITIQFETDEGTPLMALNLPADKTKIEVPVRGRIGTDPGPLPADIVLSLSVPGAATLAYDAPTGWATITRVSSGAAAFQVIATSPSLSLSAVLDVTVAGVVVPVADNLWWQEASAQIS